MSHHQSRQSFSMCGLGFHARTILLVIAASPLAVACFDVPDIVSLEDTDGASETGGAMDDPTVAAPPAETADTTTPDPSDSMGADARCGDGVVEGDEACDDGDQTDWDGCSAQCTIELYSRCIGEGPGSCAPIRILHAPADPDNPTFRAAVTNITGGPVDYLPAANDTPMLDSLLSNYDCVITHSYSGAGHASPSSLGDVLASYVDGGGTVVLGVFGLFWLTDTAIGEDAYSPIALLGDYQYAHFDVPVEYAWDGTTSLHHGISGYSASSIDLGTTLQGAGVEESTFTNGVIATAHRPDFHVVYVNGASGGIDVDSWHGDWPVLFANACAVGHAVSQAGSP